DCLKNFGDKLTRLEETEIMDYPKIWFLGPEARKVQGVEGGPNNNGYDDNDGNYLRVLHDHLAYRYEIIELLGKGSFGQVVKVLDHKTNTIVAIKIIVNKRKFHRQALVELKILDILRKSDREGNCNVIHMKEYFFFRKHVCITFELLGMNLYEMIQKNNFRGFSMEVVRRLAISILNCMRLLQRERIIHCDLKPENILLSKRSKVDIKVIDFGSSCFEDKIVYKYIQSRYYRAPEVILGIRYNLAIDMWSLGCILAELYSGVPMFPGENEAEQLALMMEMLGIPPREILINRDRKACFFDSKGNPKNIVNSRGKTHWPNSKRLCNVLKCHDELFLNFLEKCFVWNPLYRMKPDEAWEHPWIQAVWH
ncbi:uncharacterized protein TRIADDRAFT_33914, partial [Trichoplax adhaerens]